MEDKKNSELKEVRLVSKRKSLTSTVALAEFDQMLIPVPVKQ